MFGYRNFGILGDSIIAFRGSCEVGPTHMVDVEDIRAQDWIFSEDMLHFIIEHFDMDLEKSVVRQCLFMAIVKEQLETLNIKVQRKGDDLFIAKKKLSVSISTSSPVSTLIHCGLNISSRNTPIPTSNLIDLGIEIHLDISREDWTKLLQRNRFHKKSKM